MIDRGLRDPRLLDAMRAVPRDRFFPPDAAADAHADRAAPIGHGQTISQPYIVALMTDRLSLAGTERVLEVGTGSGYQTAILAQLAAEVFTVERVKPLLDSAFERLHESGVSNVKFRHGDGSAGWPELAPFDRILIAAVAPAVPRRLLLDQLADGGIAVLPVGTGDKQTLLRLTPPRRRTAPRGRLRLPVRPADRQRRLPQVAGSGSPRSSAGTLLSCATPPGDEPGLPLPATLRARPIPVAWASCPRVAWASRPRPRVVAPS